MKARMPRRGWQLVALSERSTLRIVYEPHSATLWVRYQDETTYAYCGVPKAVVDEFLVTQNKGAFLHATIKTYPCERQAVLGNA